MDLGKDIAGFDRTGAELDALWDKWPAPGADFLASLLGTRIGIWQFDAETRFLACDDVAAKLLGIDGRVPVPVELLRFGEQGKDPPSATFGSFEADDTASELHLQAEMADGTRRYLHLLGRSLRSHGQPNRTAGIIKDISEFHHSNQLHLERKRQLSTMIANLPGICYRCELEPPWRVSSISETVEEITGYSAEKFLSGQLHWNDIIHPDDRDMVAEAVDEAIERASRFDIRYRVTHREGTDRWVYERGQVIEPHGGGQRELEGFIFDITKSMTAMQMLADAEERYRIVCRATMDVIYDLDLRTRRIVCSAEFASFLGYDKSMIGQDGSWWLQQVHPADRKRVLASISRLQSSRESEGAIEYRFRRADGSYADVYASLAIMRDNEGIPVRAIGAIQDLSDRKLADAALKESEAVNRGIVSASRDCIKLLDPEGRLLFINEFGANALGLEDASSIYGRKLQSFWPASEHARIKRAIAKAKRGGVGRFSGMCPTLTGDKRWWDVVISSILDETGQPIKLLAISRDISDHHESEQRLVRAANIDALTGLPNRNLFNERLAEAIRKAHCQKQRTSVGLLLVDLDGFKQINDTLGHDAGDFLLKTVSQRLEGMQCDAVTCARLGGDEFAFIVEDLHGEAELQSIAESIQMRLREPFVHANRLLDCHATVGTAICPTDATNPNDLLKCADMALYVAKNSAPGSVLRFAPSHRTEVRRRASMVNRARTALQQGIVTPFYQPVVALSDHRIVGYEALLRLQRAGSRSIGSPAAIMAAFEDPDLALAISRRMFDQVVCDMRDWLDRDVAFDHVAINAAAAELRSDGFADWTLELLAKAGIGFDRLRLEVTETVFLGRGAEHVGRTLKSLAKSGVKVLLDDFGTGYASLSHLRQITAHGIKIDRSFVRDMLRSKPDFAIIEAIVGLAERLDLEVIAEGIETDSQADELAALGCCLGQGFLFSPAVPAERVSKEFHLGKLHSRAAPARASVGTAVAYGGHA